MAEGRGEKQAAAGAETPQGTRRRSRALSHIYARVAAGTALARVLDEDEALPRPTTFWRWHMEDAGVREALTRARVAGMEALLDEALAIADGTAGGGGAEGDATSAAAISARVQRDKLRIDTRFRYAQLIAQRAGDDAGWSEGEGPDEVTALTRLAALADRLARRDGREGALPAPEPATDAPMPVPPADGTARADPGIPRDARGRARGQPGTPGESPVLPLSVPPLFARIDRPEGGHGHAAPHAG